MERVVQILLIEDDILHQKDVRRELERRGVLHRLTVVSNGNDALRYLENCNRQTEPPDIILLDLHTTATNVFDFLKRLRANSKWKNCKVYLLSGFDDPRARTMVANSEVSGCIIKPLRFEQPSSGDAFHLMIDIANMQQNNS